MLILLPPSEGKTAARRGSALRLDGLSFPTLAEPRAQVLEALLRLCRTDGDAGLAHAVATLRLGGTQEAEVRRNAGLLAAPTARADRVYRGVLYEALDVGSLSAAARRRATSWVAVTSGLFGLLRLTDRVPAYRLAGDVALPEVGTVSTYWSRHLDGAVREAAGNGLVVDLRSSTYAGFWRPGPDLARKVATVRVLHEVDGRRQVVSHFNKATKGRIVRALVEDGASPSSVLRLSDHLRALGWKVEQGERGPRGTGLDVVVSAL